MADFSGFWTTGAPGTGDQKASYDQADWQKACLVMAACSGFQGVAPGYQNKLAATYTGVNTVSVNTGAAIVDGKFYLNYAAQNVTIPSASAGHYRIDRIVALADWATFEVRLAVKSNPLEDAVAPALTVTEDWTVSGTHYAILLYQARVTDAGVVTLTDERQWATPTCDETTMTTTAGALNVKTSGIDSGQIAAGAIDLAHMSANSVDSDQYVDGSIDTAHIAAGAITLALMANDSVGTAQLVDGDVGQVHLDVGASKVTNRQGGDASIWNTVGTNNYAVASARIQCGAILSSAVGDTTVTFPVAFNAAPIVFITYKPVVYPADIMYQVIDSITVNGFTFNIYNDADARVICNCYWLAIGSK